MKRIKKTLSLNTASISLTEYPSVNSCSVIFVHGAGSNSLVFGLLSRRLKTGTGVICFDLPGHGGSESEEIPSLSLYAESLRKIVEYCSAGTIILAGHSMGGIVILEYLQKYPEFKPDGLIFISTAPVLPVARGIFDLIANDFTKFCETGPSFMFSREVSGVLLELGREGLRATGKETLQRDFEICNKADYTEMTCGIKIPALILSTQKDFMVPLKKSALLESIPGSKHIIYEMNGHMPHCEFPDRVSADIIDFIEPLKKRSR